jgi:hypothetical protein
MSGDGGHRGGDSKVARFGGRPEGMKSGLYCGEQGICDRRQTRPSGETRRAEQRSFRVSPPGRTTKRFIRAAGIGKGSSRGDTELVEGLQALPLLSSFLHEFSASFLLQSSCQAYEWPRPKE